MGNAAATAQTWIGSGKQKRKRKVLYTVQY